MVMTSWGSGVRGCAGVCRCVHVCMGADLWLTILGSLIPALVHFLSTFQLRPRSHSCHDRYVLTPGLSLIHRLRDVNKASQTLWTLGFKSGK